MAASIARFAGSSFSFDSSSWGSATLHPRLYAYACFAGLDCKLNPKESSFLVNEPSFIPDEPLFVAKETSFRTDESSFTAEEVQFGPDEPSSVPNEV